MRWVAPSTISFMIARSGAPDTVAFSGRKSVL